MIPPDVTAPRIAIVWDDPDITAMFAYFLGDKGYAVKLAHTLKQGLELCVSDPPDLLIAPRRFDNRPDGGLELCQQVRAIAELSHLPIIVGENEPGKVKRGVAFSRPSLSAQTVASAGSGILLMYLR